MYGTLFNLPDVSSSIAVPIPEGIATNTLQQPVSQNAIVFPWSRVVTVPKSGALTIAVGTFTASTTSEVFIHKKYFVTRSSEN